MLNPLWKSSLVVVGLLVGASLPQVGLAKSCGATERWFVKVGTDPDANLVQLGTSIPMTVQGMNQLPKLQPTVPAGDNQIRLPAERVVYEVSGRLALFKNESNSAYHMDINGYSLR